MDNINEPQNCWDYWKCTEESKKHCPAAQTDSGRECWFVASTKPKNDNSPKSKKNFKNCFDCPWFKKLNPDFNA